MTAEKVRDQAKCGAAARSGTCAAARSGACAVAQGKRKEGD